MKTNTSNLNESRGHNSRLTKPSKQDANLPKNGVLRFQIGLIIGLAAAYFAIEATFAVTDYVNTEPVVVEDDEVYELTDYRLEKNPEKKIEPQKKMSEFIDEVNVVDNDAAVEEKDEYKDEPVFEDDITLSGIDYEDVKHEEPPVVPWEKVEFVPLFPGCESLPGNEERKKCMNDAINRIVQENFDSSLAGAYGLEGIQRIYAQFKIDQNGKVVDVKVRAPHKILEDETRRVIELIPDMEPGKQRDRNVSVVFLKPIVFKVQ